MSDSSICLVCNKSGSQGIAKVTKKGLETIISASRQRNDNKWQNLTNAGDVFIHKQCRKEYTHPTNLSKLKSNEPSTSKVLRSTVSKEFDFKKHCFICNEYIDIQTIRKYKKKIDFRQVCTIELKNKLINRCNDRNDKLGIDVFNRINSEIDLVAAEAIYHKNCYNKFMQDNLHDQVGRPVKHPLEDAFEKICDFIENDSENCQFGIKELVEMMVTFLPVNIEPWSEKHLKMRLKNKYKDNIIIYSQKGQQAIISLRGNCEKLLNEEWQKDKTDDRAKIVIAAAKIIKEDIRGMVCNLQEYPNLDQIKTGGTEIFPESLNSFFYELVLRDKKNLAAYKTKVAAMQNFIVSLVRVRSFVSPTMFGLGTLLHRKYGSKNLIDILSTLGVSVSYSECLNFESSAIINVKENISADSFLQFVFDNADVNTRTIDGHGTFHSMGGIICISPEPSTENFQVPRPKEKIAASEIAHFGSLPVKVSYLFNKIVVLNNSISFSFITNPQNMALRRLQCPKFKF